MKKLLVVLLLFLTLGIYAKEYKFYEGECYKYSDILGHLVVSDFYINYEDSIEVFYFAHKEPNHQSVVTLNLEGVVQLRLILEKYFEWNNLAISKGVKLEKAIPYTKLDSIFFNIIDGEMYLAKSSNIKFIFFSQTTVKHQLVITVGKVPSIQNQYIDCSMEDLYLDFADVQALYDALSEESINAKKSEYKGQNEIEDLFQ